MLLLQIAATAALVHIVSANQLNRIASKVQTVSLRQALGDSSAAAELPTKELAVFVSSTVIGSFWTAIVAGLAGVWSL